MNALSIHPGKEISTLRQASSLFSGFLSYERGGFLRDILTCIVISLFLLCHQGCTSIAPISAYNPTKAYFLSSGTQYLWQTNSEGDDIHIIDIVKREVISRLIVGPEPHGIAAPDDGHIIYITLESNGKPKGELIGIDPLSLAVEFRIVVGPEPHAIATTPDGRWVYVPCRDGNYWVVDATKKSVVKKIYTGGRPHNTTASSDGRFMYLSPMGPPKKVTVVDIEGGHIPIATIPFSNSVRPPALTLDNRRLFQHVDGLNGFEVADVISRKVIEVVKHENRLGWFLLHKKLGWISFDGFQRCHGLAVRPDQKEIWSTCGEAVTIHSIEDHTYPEIAMIPMRNDAYWLTFSPDSRYAFVPIRDWSMVAMVNTHTKEVIKHFSVGKAPKRNLVIVAPDVPPMAGEN